MKAIVIVLLVLVVACVAQRDELRLIEFNSTHRSWVPQSQVVQMATECGIGKGFMDVTDHQDLNSTLIQTYVKALPAIPTKPSQQSLVNPLLTQLNIQNLHKFISTFSSFPTRYYTSKTSVEASDWLHGQYTNFASGRTDISISFFAHKFLEPSVIARIEGNGPNKDEIVILGGHIDSISRSGNAPGADDDASGSMSVLEIFRVLVLNNFKPSRTIEFHGYAAEEVGLLGSQDIASAYVKQGKIVASMMQLDMTAYFAPGSTPVISITSDYTSKELNAFVKELIVTYTALPVYVEACGYACSDHASWNKVGFAACHPFEAPQKYENKQIHTSSDVLSRLNLEHAMQFARLGLGYVVELSTFTSN